MDSLRNSFKTLGSSQAHPHPNTQIQELQPILFDHDGMKTPLGLSERKEIVLNIDGGNQGEKIWRESSYDFLEDAVKNSKNGTSTTSTRGEGGGGGGGGFDFQKGHIIDEDPPSKLIGKFLHKQKLSGDMSLDMDLEMIGGLNGGEGGADQGFSLPPITETQQISPKLQTPRVSFTSEIGLEGLRQKSKRSNDERGSGVQEGEVLRCTSNASFQTTKSFLTTRTTKSRLMDAPVDEQQDKKSGRSGNLRSGFMGKSFEEEEEDPFADDDLPHKFKKEKLGVWSVLQWVSLLLIVAAFVCTFAIPKFFDKEVKKFPLWKWEILVLVLICGRLVSGWVIRVVVYFIEKNFLLRKRVLYFVYGVRKAVQNCLWLGLVLLAWHLIFNKKVEKEVHILDKVNKILICLLVTTLLWLLKTILLKMLASSFHVNTYFDRIQEALFNQYAIKTLSGPPLIEIENAQEEEEKLIAEVQKLQTAGANIPVDLRASAFSNMKSGRIIGSGVIQQGSPRDRKSFKISGLISKQKEEGITVDQLHKMNQKNISAWNMKRMVNIVQRGVLSTLDERILDATDEDEAESEIRSELEAKCAAKKIFHNVAKPGAKFIYLEDLMRFMREDEALKTMSLFEGATESKRVKKSSLKNWVVNAFRERKALALTLSDTKTAVNRLHQMVNCIMIIVIIVIWLLILGIAGTKILVFISSQLLLYAFMFGNTFKMVFESIIFLFVMHPFDVGDRCEIEGVQMVVEEMNILTTVFLRYDNQKITYPNSVLSTKPISNFYRSPDMGDAIDFCVHISTPVEKIALMKERIIAYCENKKEHWAPGAMVVVRDVEDLNRLKISVWPTHRMNFHDMGERWVRRAQLVEEMIRIFRDLDIEYRMLPLDVNVRNLSSPSSNRLPSNWTACTN